MGSLKRDTNFVYVDDVEGLPAPLCEAGLPVSVLDFFGLALPEPELAGLALSELGLP